MSIEASSAARSGPGFMTLESKLDRDMGVAARDHRAADEHDPHQAVARDLLGPGQAVVEHIAREELQEDDEGEAQKIANASQSSG